MAFLARRSIGILVLLSTAAFAGAWNFTFLAPVLPDVAGDTGVSVTAAGQLVTASALVTVAFLVLLGPLADRYGRRPMLMLGLAAMALAALGSAATSSYALLMLLRVLSGVGDALVLPSAAAAIGDYFDKKDREVALNVLLVPMGAGVVIGLPVVVLVSDAFDWHAAFLLFGLLNLACLVGIAALLPRPTYETPSPPKRLSDHYRESYGEVLGKRTALAILAAAVLGATVWNGMVTYAGAFFEDELGAEGGDLSALFAAVGGSYVLGGAVGAALARRAPPRPIAVLSALGAAVFLLPLVLTTDVAPVAIVLALAFAASRSPGIAALNNMLLDLAPGAQATAISVYGVVAASGALAGAATGGLALAVEGYVTMASVFTLMALSAAALLLMPVSEAPLRKRERLAVD